MKLSAYKLQLWNFSFATKFSWDLQHVVDVLHALAHPLVELVHVELLLVLQPLAPPFLFLGAALVLAPHESLPHNLVRDAAGRARRHARPYAALGSRGQPAASARNDASPTSAQSTKSTASSAAHRALTTSSWASATWTQPRSTSTPRS